MATNGSSTLRVPIDGILTEVTPVIDEDGSRDVLGDGFAYKTPVGTFYVWEVAFTLAHSTELSPILLLQMAQSFPWCSEKRNVTTSQQGTSTLRHRRHLSHVGPSQPQQRKSASDPLSPSFGVLRGLASSSQNTRS
ncbi:hypothetical protein MTO96_017939 [Rhipicephalus appendiculatus]